MDQIDQSDLRDFIVHFKDGKKVNLRAARFGPIRRTSENVGVSFSIDIALEGKDTKACIYVNRDEVAAIVPVYTEADEGQVFKVTLKSGTEIDIRAGGFRVSPLDTLDFYGEDGTYQRDVYVLISEVLACVPVGSVPPALPPLGIAST